MIFPVIILLCWRKWNCQSAAYRVCLKLFPATLVYRWLRCYLIMHAIEIILSLVNAGSGVPLQFYMREQSHLLKFLLENCCMHAIHFSWKICMSKTFDVLCAVKYNLLIFFPVASFISFMVIFLDCLAVHQEQHEHWFISGICISYCSNNYHVSYSFNHWNSLTHSLTHQKL